MNSKATRLQAWAPARVGRRPPPSKIKKIWALLGAFLLHFLHMGPFCYFFVIWGPFATFFLFLGASSPYVGAFLLLFTSWWGPLFGLAPPPLRKFLRASMIARRVREHAPRKKICVTAI